MNADGSDQKRLTFNERAPDWTPFFSPDGKEVVYVSNESVNWEIWTVDLDTLERKHHTPDSGGNFVPRWRPDGAKILYLGWRGGKYPEVGSFDLVLMNPDGAGKKELAPSPVMEMSSRWSPDGSRILFWSWRTGNPEIFVMNADGSDLRQLTNNLAWDMFPSWSPDGKRIAFDSDRMGNFDIWVVEVPR